MSSTTATAIAEAIQTQLQTLSRFNDQSIRINDWHMIEGSTDLAPWIRIETPGLVSCRRDGMRCTILQWQVRLIVIRPFAQWDDTRSLLEADRTQIVNFYAASANRNIIDGVYTSLEDIRDENPNEPTAPGWRQNEQNPDLTVPTWLALPLIMDISEERA
jgi:hypothetical protein